MKTVLGSTRYVALSILAIVLGYSSVAYANITGVTDWTWSSGISCYTPLLDSSPQLVISATQYGAGPVQMGGTLLADSIDDPTLTINDQINNQSGVDWSGFILDVYMSTNFTFSSIPPNTYPFVANPSGWTAAVTIAPNYIGGGQYMGQITFSGGTPVSANPASNNNLLNFSYQVTFNGSLSYGFSEQATAIPVPEPTAAGCLLAGLGVLVGFARLKRGRQI